MVLKKQTASSNQQANKGSGSSPFGHAKSHQSWWLNSRYNYVILPLRCQRERIWINWNVNDLKCSGKYSIYYGKQMKGKLTCHFSYSELVHHNLVLGGWEQFLEWHWQGSPDTARAPDGISTRSEFLSLSHHPRGSTGILTRCFWQKFCRRIPTPSILLGKVARCAGCLLVQRVRLEIAFSSVPMPV